MKEIYKLIDVSYRYPNGVLALDNVNLSVYKNEIVAILGPNGAGKTTLLKILDGLVFPDKGEVYFEGRRLTDEILTNKELIMEFRRKVGFVFQNPDVMLFNPTVWDEVAFSPLHLYSKEKALEVTDKVLEDMKIYHLKDRHPYNLSGGEKKKVSISCILSVEPEVILMDEPTSALDPKSRIEVIKLIKSFKENGKTVILITHDVNITSLADRCYVLNKKIIFEGTPKELFSLDLDKLNLDVPDVSKLFIRLRNMGYNVGDIPLTINEAVDLLLKMLKN
ncbi:energy-coupling factor ABC transporter ATP-binding protein [Methanotorris formicicus]|uniref:ABC transporter related protein n=1 Tax=Methanotorris formicicus Mc-S-70 TaxID=647171 RepID=H1KX64_9EURY|nr:energy-coupling factor ABC transporter ATP-binding protein [Methanotorris formicicus]EHP88589.1 ABC transporter related protein [Methanotorris formicicus Mc-S-70]